MGAQGGGRRIAKVVTTWPKGRWLSATRRARRPSAVRRNSQLLEDTLGKLNSDVGALQAKIKDAKARQNAIIVRGKAAQSRLGVRRTLSDHNIDDAIARFELYERKMDDLEGEIEAHDMGQKTLSDEIAELEGDEGVDDQLSQLKARVKGEEASPASVTDVNQNSAK